MTGDPAPAVLSTADTGPPARASGAPARREQPTGTLVGVGTGPGDPDLVTVRAADLLAEADVVFVLVTDPGATGTGSAERIALHYTEAWRVERLVVAPHERGWDAAAAEVAGWFDGHAGGLAAVATTGDPCVYSAFTDLAESVRALAGDLHVRIVPGITAMQDVAARAGTPLVQGGEAMQLFPTAAGPQRFREACERGDTVVAHEPGRMPPETLAVLRETGRFDDAVYEAGSGPPGETAPGPYLSTLLVPPARTGRGGAPRGA